MRDIHFRGMPIENSVRKGKWIYGNLHVDYDGRRAFIDNVPVEFDSVGQYTGVKDEYSVRIYEDDLVKRLGVIGVVTWECEYTALGFYLKSGEKLMGVINPYSSWSLVKVGNTHETPELLNS